MNHHPTLLRVPFETYWFHEALACLLSITRNDVDVLAPEAVWAVVAEAPVAERLHV
jgi:hypothetical protein